MKHGIYSTIARNIIASRILDIDSRISEKMISDFLDGYLWEDADDLNIFYDHVKEDFIRSNIDLQIAIIQKNYRRGLISEFEALACIKDIRPRYKDSYCDWLLHDWNFC